MRLALYLRNLTHAVMRKWIPILFFLILGSGLNAQWRYRHWGIQHVQPPRSRLYIATDFQNCGTGIKDTVGNWVVQPIYEKIYELGHDYFAVMIGSKQGVVGPDGKLILQPQYDY